jgi:hypothetical protein
VDVLNAGPTHVQFIHSAEGWLAVDVDVNDEVAREAEAGAVVTPIDLPFGRGGEVAGVLNAVSARIQQDNRRRAFGRPAIAQCAAQAMEASDLRAAKGSHIAGHRAPSNEFDVQAVGAEGEVEVHWERPLHAS